MRLHKSRNVLWEKLGPHHNFKLAWSNHKWLIARWIDQPPQSDPWWKSHHFLPNVKFTQLVYQKPGFTCRHCGGLERPGVGLSLHEWHQSELAGSRVKWRQSPAVRQPQGPDSSLWLQQYSPECLHASATVSARVEIHKKRCSWALLIFGFRIKSPEFTHTRRPGRNSILVYQKSVEGGSKQMLGIVATQTGDALLDIGISSKFRIMLHTLKAFQNKERERNCKLYVPRPQARERQRACWGLTWVLCHQTHWAVWPWKQQSWPASRQPLLQWLPATSQHSWPAQDTSMQRPLHLCVSCIHLSLFLPPRASQMMPTWSSSSRDEIIASDMSFTLFKHDRPVKSPGARQGSDDMEDIHSCLQGLWHVIRWKSKGARSPLQRLVTLSVGMLYLQDSQQSFHCASGSFQTHIDELSQLCIHLGLFPGIRLHHI